MGCAGGAGADHRDRGSSRFQIRDESGASPGGAVEWAVGDHRRLEARDTQLMRDALRTLGVDIVEDHGEWQVTPPKAFVAGGVIDCGLAGTVMRFVPPIAALAHGTVRFDGDQQAYARPMAPLLGALKRLGARVDGNGHSLPFNLTGNPKLPGGDIIVDAAASSQFLSGLLLAGARYADGIDIQHIGGEIPSRPHVQMTLAMLRDRGVEIDDTTPNRWVVSPGAIQPLDVTIEPDLSNAAPFLAAAAITGGTVTVPNWPSATIQPGDAIRDILRHFGARGGAGRRQPSSAGHRPHPRSRS